MAKPIHHVQLSSDAEAFIAAATPFWRPDESADACERCVKPFSFTVRRHHCRDCGGIFCSDCTPHRATLTYRPGALSAGKQRVCSYCWFFIDLHQRQEHDRQNEARRMQQRAQDEGFMRRMVESTTGTMQHLRQHMERELLGRSRVAFSPRSVAASSTRYSDDDDDGGYLVFDRAASGLPAALAGAASGDHDECLRNNIVEADRVWQATVRRQKQSAEQTRELFTAPVLKMPAPAFALFLELADKCGVNPGVDANNEVGQSVLAATRPAVYHRVTEDSVMAEGSVVGIAAYFRT